MIVYKIIFWQKQLNKQYYYCVVKQFTNQKSRQRETAVIVSRQNNAMKGKYLLWYAQISVFHEKEKVRLLFPILYWKGVFELRTSTGSEAFSLSIERLTLLSPSGDQHQFSPKSIDCPDIRSWELINWSLKRKCFDLLSNSPNTFFKEMYID